MSADPRASERSVAAPVLATKLLELGQQFGFFQLVHLLETWQARTSGVGGQGPYRAEGVRFRPHASLAFPSSDIERVTRLGHSDDARQDVYEITINFTGLYGVASPTPVYLTEMLGATDVDAEEATDFLDLFNHRMLSLYCRAWKKYRFWHQYQPGRREAAAREDARMGGRDVFTARVLALIGLDERSMRLLASVPAARLTKYVGLLAARPRSEVGLELLLHDAFGQVPVRVEPWLLRYVPVAHSERNRLGHSHCRLAVDLSVGERVPDRGGRFRVEVGPLDFEQYRSFLPGGDHYRELCRYVELWVSERMEFDLALKLRHECVPGIRLVEGDPGARLGLTSWVVAGPGRNSAGLDRDPEVIFPPLEAAA